MILEHGLEGTSAKYNATTNTYDIRQKPMYRWCTPDNKPASPWYTDISDALLWIKQHDTKNIPAHP